MDNSELLKYIAFKSRRNLALFLIITSLSENESGRKGIVWERSFSRRLISFKLFIDTST